MDRRSRAIFVLILVRSVVILFASGCSKTEPATNSKIEGTQPIKTNQSAIAPDSAAPGDTLLPLLELLPRNLWPRDDKDASWLDEADKWLKANLIGKRASVSTSLPEINIIPPSKPGEKYRVTLLNGLSKGEHAFYVIRGKGQANTFRSGHDLWGRHLSVELRKSDVLVQSVRAGLNLTVDKPELDRLRTLETRPGGKDVSLTFTIDEIHAGSVVTIVVRDLVIEKAVP